MAAILEYLEIRLEFRLGKKLKDLLKLIMEFQDIE